MARKQLLNLFGVTGTLQPLTIQRVTKLIEDNSLQAFISCGKTKKDWRQWMQERGKVNLNTPNEASRNDSQPGTKTEPPSFDDAPEWAKYLTRNNFGIWEWHQEKPRRTLRQSNVDVWLSSGKSLAVRFDYNAPVVIERDVESGNQGNEPIKQ